MVTKVSVIVLLLCVLSTSGCGNHGDSVLATTEANDEALIQIVVPIMDKNNSQIGQAVMTQQDKGVHFNVQVSGLTPGAHGLHIHEKALCEAPDFKSAGEHFNPHKNEHGFLNPKGPHAGDLPNITADSSGDATAEFVTGRLTLELGKKHSVFRDGGTALMIHATADDNISNPAGNAGDRVACGIIKR